MARKPQNKVMRAIADAMWKRDQLQMRAADALLSRLERPKRKRVQPKSTPRRPAAKGQR
jgi:IS4 transposase